MAGNSTKEDMEKKLIPTKSVDEEISPEILKEFDAETTTREVFVEPPIKLVPTLPEFFKSLVEFPIGITNENRKPQNIISLLGDALGVDDYKTNIASFWFLDFIALQVLRFENDLDDYGRSIMVSWLAGEMKLIQDMKLSHEAFLREMKKLFSISTTKISQGQPLLHWNSIPAESNEGDIFVESNETVIINNEKATEPEIRSSNILEFIIEATYSMYGDNFHYALIVEAFVEPVQLHEYILPFTFRQPRPLKMFDLERYMEKNTRENSQNSLGPRKSKDLTKKKTNDKKTKKRQSSETFEVIQEPTGSVGVSEEELLLKKREFILPLMEANEASDILKEYGQTK